MNQIGQYQLYPELEAMGFTAGVTLKNSWSTFDDVYLYVKTNLVPPDRIMIIPKQVHGADIAILNTSNSNSKYEVDGIITEDVNLCLTVTTADCLPLLLVDPTAGIISAIHIGWRCFVGGIIENFFEIAKKLGANSDKLRAVIGPGIESCCFEVGPDVAILFDEEYIYNRQNVCYVDLRQALRNKLESLGVVKSNISSLSECTSCLTEKYYSYRRDKDSPIQMVTFIFTTER